MIKLISYKSQCSLYKPNLNKLVLDFQCSTLGNVYDCLSFIPSNKEYTNKAAECIKCLFYERVENDKPLSKEDFNSIMGDLYIQQENLKTNFYKECNTIDKAILNLYYGKENIKT